MPNKRELEEDDNEEAAAHTTPLKFRRSNSVTRSLRIGESSCSCSHPYPKLKFSLAHMAGLPIMTPGVVGPRDPSTPIADKSKIPEFSSTTDYHRIIVSSALPAGSDPLKDTSEKILQMLELRKK